MSVIFELYGNLFAHFVYLWNALPLEFSIWGYVIQAGIVAIFIFFPWGLLNLFLIFFVGIPAISLLLYANLWFLSEVWNLDIFSFLNMFGEENIFVHFFLKHKGMPSVFPAGISWDTLTFSQIITGIYKYHCFIFTGVITLLFAILTFLLAVLFYLYWAIWIFLSSIYAIVVY